MRVKFIITVLVVSCLGLLVPPSFATGPRSQSSMPYVLDLGMPSGPNTVIDVTYLYPSGPECGLAPPNGSPLAEKCVLEGARPTQPTGTITVGHVVYEAGLDFSYNETFHVEYNPSTLEGEMVVEANYVFFNLPNQPTLTELLQIQITGFMTPGSQHRGTGTLLGTKDFSQVRGSLLQEGHDGLFEEEPWFYMHHFGMIRGWPF